MSYTPTEWKSGDIVTSEKLNKLELGVAEVLPGGIVATESACPDGGILDKTWQEIHDAGYGVIFAPVDKNLGTGHSIYNIVAVTSKYDEYAQETIYYVYAYGSSDPYNSDMGCIEYTASSPSDYPIIYIII